MNKNIKFSILFILALILFVFFYLFSSKEVKVFPPASQIPTSTPTPTTYSPNNTSITNPQTQGEIDDVFNKELDNIFTSFPWYKNLPLSSADYFISFNTEKKQFEGVVFQKPNNLSPGQISKVKEEAFLKLDTIGVPKNAYPIVWEIIY